MCLLRIGLVSLVLYSSTGMTTENNVHQTPEIYAKLLPIIRRDHGALIQKMLKDDYTKKYKLISIALEKIFQVINKSNQTLIKYEYTPQQGFPLDQEKQEALTLLLENTCLAADIILHFPDISYAILKKITNWKVDINWCIAFVNSFPHIIDEKTAELMELIHQELNEEARGPDFVNPYYEVKETVDIYPKKERKPQKKIKKGPQLTVKTDL